MTGEEPYEPEAYADEISEDDVQNMINRANTAEAKVAEYSKAIQGMSLGKKDSNFLHLQISTEEMLEKLEHFYRGDYQAEEDGELVWKTQKNKDLITFNEFGISSMMEVVSKYIDKNTILSDYTEIRIFEILGDLGDDLILFMLCNYQKMGMDTYFKKTKFRLMITTTIHIIESTYRRAKHGKTLEEINQAKVVGQFGDKPLPQPIPSQRRGEGIRRWMGLQ